MGVGMGAGRSVELLELLWREGTGLLHGEPPCKGIADAGQTVNGYKIIGTWP